MYVRGGCWCVPVTACLLLRTTLCVALKHPPGRVRRLKIRHGERGSDRIPAMVLLQVHLQKPCSDFYFLKIVCLFVARSQPGPPHKGGAPI